MQTKATAIICAVLPHGEHGVIVRALTAEHGLLGGYVRGGRSRINRPILIPANVIAGEWRSRSATQLASLTAELIQSRAPLHSEPLAAAGLDWATALTAVTLPEGHPYPNLFSALDGLLNAIEYAPAARGWATALARYEELLLGELGYGEDLGNPEQPVQALARNRERMVAHVLGERQVKMLAARERLVDRLKRAVA
jgi:DNA repair protein RecO (recombination protein O)